MLSEIVDGKVLDWRFKKRKTDTLFYVGDILIGQLFKVKKTWSAVSAFPTELGAIDGFNSRWRACEYLLKIFRLQKNITPNYAATAVWLSE